MDAAAAALLIVRRTLAARRKLAATPGERARGIALSFTSIFALRCEATRASSPASNIEVLREGGALLDEAEARLGLRPH